MERHEFEVDGLVIRLTNDEAIDLLNKFRQTFGWQGTEFQRVDIEDTIGRTLTDDEWSNVRDNYYWYKGITEQACQGGWTSIENLVSELNLVEGEV